MANTETVVIDRVEEENGWHRVYFVDDDLPASTRDNNLAKIAMSQRGSEVTVVTNTTQRGKYTNRYLNEINGEKESRNGGSKSAPAPRRGGGGSGRNDDARQAQISAQWAVGRALEVFTLTDSSVDLKGLTAEQKTFIEETAQFVTALKDKLAG